jgi:hypothetical protein
LTFIFTPPVLVMVIDLVLLAFSAKLPKSKPVGFTEKAMVPGGVVVPSTWPVLILAVRGNEVKGFLRH